MKHKESGKSWQRSPKEAQKIVKVYLRGELKVDNHQLEQTLGTLGLTLETFKVGDVDKAKRVAKWYKRKPRA